MAERRIVKGRIIERLDNGTFLDHGPAGGDDAPVKPDYQKGVAELPYAAPQAAANVDKTQTDIVDTREDNRRADTQLKAELFAKGLRIGANGEIEPIPGWKPLPTAAAPSAEQAAADRDRISRLNQLIEQINRTQELFEAGPGKTSGIYALKDYLPSDANSAFDTAGAALSQQGLAAFRVPGTGTVSDRDAVMFDRANLPTASTRDSSVEEQLRGMRRRVEAELESLGRPAPVWIGEDRPNAMTQTRAVAGDPLQAAAFGATEGVTDTYPPEMVAKHEALIGRLILQGGGRIDPQAYAEARSALDAEFKYTPNTTAYAAWAQKVNDDFLAKGGKSVPGDIRPPERELTTGEFLHHSMVNNPVGAALVGAGDMGSFGAVSALTGDDVRALGDQGGWTGAGLTAGQIAGSIYGAGNVGKLAGWTTGKLLPSQVATSILRGGGKWGKAGRDLGTDGLYSGIVGTAQGEDPLNSAVFGLGGSAAGRIVGKAGGMAAGGIATSAPVQALRARGIPLTGGRILGDTASKIEDKMASWPIVGDMIGRRHQDSFEGLSRAMFEEGGAPIGFSPTAIGQEGVEQFRTAKGRAFDNATAGVSVPEDAQFSGDLVNVASARMQLPDDLRPRFDRLMENHTSGIAQTGVLTGEAYQRAMRGLKTARGKAGTVAGEFEEPYREALSLGMDAFDGLMRRGGGEDVVQGLNDANAGHKNFKIIEDAIVNRARNGTRAGEVGLPAPSQWVDAAAASERKYGANTLRPIAEDAQRVLPSSVPNSGTADRLQLAGLGLAGLGAAGGGEAYATGDMSTTGKVAAALAILTAGGTKTGQKALAKALLDRPDALKTTGRWLNARSGLFGRAMIPMTLPDSYQP